MRITIASVGRGRGGPAEQLFKDYVARLPWPVTLREVEERRPLPLAQRIAREAALLRQAIPSTATVVALDAGGRMLDSAGLAERLRQWRDAGTAELALVIGGADGLDPALRASADLVLSLGPMTWPHLLVRALLAEQLYRSASILAGHPYHRA